MVERRRILGSAVACLVGALLLCMPASAQTVLGRVAGTVLDASGAVLPGASITLTNVATNQVSTAITTETGAFIFPQVPAGTYKIVVELQDSKAATYNQVIVNVGQEYSLTAKLELVLLTETVEVLAGVSLVKTTTPEVSTTVQQKEVLALPIPGRDVTNLIRLQAGVPGITQRSNTAIDGGRPTWTVDAIPQVGGDGRVAEINAQVQALSLDLAKLREKYKEGHPEVQRVQVQVQQLRKDKELRIGEIEESLRAEYRQLQRREAELKDAIDAHKGKAAEQSRKLTELESLKKQAESRAGLYSVLLQKLNETNIAASIQNNNVRLLDRAIVPSAPVWPRKRQIALLSLVGGLLLGAAFVLARDALDNTLKDADDVERHLHLEGTGEAWLRALPLDRYERRNGRSRPRAMGTFRQSGRLGAEDVDTRAQDEGDDDGDGHGIGRSSRAKTSSTSSPTSAPPRPRRASSILSPVDRARTSPLRETRLQHLSQDGRKGRRRA